MKNLFFLFIISVFLFSCGNEPEKETTLVGKWKLTETMMDPDDGSGTYKPVKSDKYVDFLLDGTIKSNGSLCLIEITPQTPSNGTYSLSDSTINPSDCEFDLPLKVRFRQKGSTLIINYPCIEGCGEKYVKE